MTESESNAKLAPNTIETVEVTNTIEGVPANGSDVKKEANEAVDRLVKPEVAEVKTTLDALSNKKKPEQNEEIVAEATIEAQDTPAVAKAPTDAELLDELLRYLEEDSFTMDTTERQLRNRLEKHFGVPLKDRKTIIRDKIMDFIQAKQDQEDAEAGEGREEGAEGGEEVSGEEEEDEPVKKKRKGGGGLNASCRLSEPLQAFLGEESMSRPQVVKALWAYIKENDLQDPSNKRKIILDEKLETLFTKPLDGPVQGAEPDEEGVASSKKATPKPKRRAEASADKPTKKSKSSSADPDAAKKPNAFTRPLKVSPELSEWLGGQTSISRPQLTKHFWAYAKDNNLLNPEKKSIINCDEALKKLTGEESFQCFGFAKYFKKHLLGYADEPAE